MRRSAVVDKTVCVACGVCVKECPKQALSVYRGCYALVNSEKCVGCGKCASICPARAIDMVEKKAVINRAECIRCFCCQEFCPVGAMKVHRTAIARLLVRSGRR